LTNYTQTVLYLAILVDFLLEILKVQFQCGTYHFVMEILFVKITSRLHTKK